MSKPPTRPRPMKTFMALLLGHTMIDCFGGVWPVFKKLAELDLAWAGLISTVATLGTMSLQPLFGIWADQGHRRRFILAGVAMGTMGMLLGPLGVSQTTLGTGPAYLLMFVVLLAVRLGQAMFHPPATSVAGDAIGHRRSMLVCVFISGGMLGFASSQSLFSFAYDRLAGQTQWLMLIAIPVGWIIFTWCRPTENNRGPKPTWTDLRMIIQLLKTKLRVIFLILVLISAQMMGIFFLLPELLQSKGYPPWIVNGGGFGMMIGGSILLMVPMGHLADKLGRRRTLGAALVMAFISYYLFIMLPLQPLGLFIPLCLVTGGMIGSSNPLGIALGQTLLPKQTGLVSGMLMGLAWSLGGLAPLGVGYLAAKPQWGPQGALMLLGITNILAILLCFWIPSTHEPHTHHPLSSVEVT